ncbi:MAG: NUDIX hydrolase [Kiritimatiellia bacterium]
MERHIETIARGVCIVDGKVLLCLPKDRSYAYLPGGHIEFGETGREALVREMKEETGLDVTAGRLLDVVESQFVQQGERHCEINLIFAMSLVSPLSVDVPPPVREDWICFDWCPCDKIGAMKLLPPEMKGVLGA